MKSFGSTLAILGILAIVLDFVNMVPKVLAWIYSWGDGVAWGIKIGLIVVGGLLWLRGWQRVRAAAELTTNIKRLNVEFKQSGGL